MYFTLESIFVFFSSTSYFLSCCCEFSTPLYILPQKRKNKCKNGIKKRNPDTTFKARINCTKKLKNANKILNYFIKALEVLFEVILSIKASQNFATVSGPWEEKGDRGWDVLILYSVVNSTVVVGGLCDWEELIEGFLVVVGLYFLVYVVITLFTLWSISIINQTLHK